MKTRVTGVTRTLRCVVVCFVLIGVDNAVHGQPRPSLSVSWDILPYQVFDDPIVDTVVGSDTTFLEDPQVRLRKLRASLSYPVVLAGGKAIVVNDFFYQLIEFEYKELDFPLERLHSAGYTLMLQYRLSQRWSAWALVTPGLASDLEAEVSEADFNFQAAMVCIRHFSERLSLGFGAAYSTQFGEPEMVPILAFDWNNGKNLMAKAIVPVSLEFWYRPHQRVDLGLFLSGDGNSFHGDPDIYNAADPDLRYTMMTFGPAAKIRMSSWALFVIEAGIIGLHRFEFFDGDNEVASYDLQPSHYIRAGVQFGK